MVFLEESLARRRFAALVAVPEVPLARAALAIAEEEYPGLDAAACLRQVDDLALQVERGLHRRDAATIIRQLRKVLFEEGGFRGNAGAYYDPRNSFLNEVLERRLGIPITLGILAIEVAARAGLTLHGVGFPGHFLVKHVSGTLETFMDPFHGGEILDADDCMARLRAIAPRHGPDPGYLQAISTRKILARMLRNLKKIYVETGDDVRALWVIDRLVLLAPEDASERRDRGLVEARLGGVAPAIADLEAYLSVTPAAEDVPSVRAILDELRVDKRLLN